MHSAKKTISVIVLCSLLFSTTFSTSLGAILPTVPKPLLISEDTFTLPDAKVGTTYEYQFQSEGGLAPLTWKVAEGQLPLGLRLEGNGTLHGVPSQAKAEAFVFVIEVADSARTPQRFSLPCLIMVQAAPLRIVTGAPKLRIVTNNTDSQPSTPDISISPRQTDTLIADVSGTFTEARPATSLTPTRAFTPRTARETVPALSPTNANNKVPAGFQGGRTAANHSRNLGTTAPSEQVNPANYIRIYEDTEGAKRILVYDPTVDEQIRVKKLSVDKASKLIIVPDPDLMNEELALNNLYMKATLAPRNAEIEIEGYSKVGESRAAVQAQRAVAFQSVKNIVGKILTMAFTADDIVDTTTKASETNRNQALTERLLLYSPEIEGIATFFLDEKNRAIVDLIGVRVFFIDGQTLQKVTTQYQELLQVALDSKSDQAAKNAALKVLLERARMVNNTFESLKSEIIGNNQLSTQERRKKYFDFGIQMANDAIKELKKYIAEGHISLLAAKAEDGELLTLSIEARGSDGGSVGIPAVFEIAIKQFGPKLTLTDSFLFIKRLGLAENDILASPNGRGLKSINYAPSPGVSFGVNYFKRGNGAAAKFFRALAPGVGVNVSFMNYNDPSFDLSTGRFTNTTGENVQVGAGIVGMLFHNNIQFSYGYNLNAEIKRRYFGVGFSFVDFTKRVAKIIKE